MITILDTEMTELIQSVSKMLSSLKEKGKNKVLDRYSIIVYI